ncbi:unnamed protein product [Pedinophyceae sp. YPF-701]|nr:unnamed protein product [Pedinophyceae sp. YPF-701]
MTDHFCAPQRCREEEKPTRGKRSRVIAGAGDTPAAVDHPLHEDPYDEIEGNGTLLPARVLDSVIKIFCMHTEPNFSLPWQRKRQASSTSSGFAIPGRRILTNAHCIEYHTQVKVKRRGSDSKYVARVLAIGHECDTALLTVDDDEFWEGIEPVAFAEAGGGLPRLQDTVTVAGYPIGGDTMSVTSGVVSRIEVTSYVHGMSELLGVQIDAAINSGNSGGPAFNRQGECVGIAFQSLKDADTENLGYIIPVPVVRHFIQDYERNGKYTGFPILGIQWQKLENPDLRKSLGVSDKQGGVLVRQVDPTSTLAPHVKNGDILLSYDGTPIGQDGSVVFRSGERISFSYLVSQRYIGETAKLEVLSGGEVKRVSAKMAIPARLVPQHISDKLPSYFILAGLVFTRVTVPYLRSEYGKDYDYDAPVKLLDQMMHAVAEKADQQVVVLSQVLAHEINVGYEDIANTQVRKVNGEKVDNLAHLVDLVDGCKDKYLRLDLEYNQVVVLEAKAARKATEEILAMHGVPTDRSTDLE